MQTIIRGASASVNTASSIPPNASVISEAVCGAFGPAVPPPSNTGGNLRGSDDSNPPGEVLIDFLSCSFPLTIQEVPELGQVLGLLLGLDLTLESQNKGLWGFSDSWRIKVGTGLDAVQLGLMACGGESQAGRGFFSLSGTGTALVRDWVLCHKMLEALGAKITRLDVAVDFLSGAYTVEDCRDAYMAGGFQQRQGGVMPSHNVQGDWFAEGSPMGRTFYVGKRKNGKMLRFYEKGKAQGDPLSTHNRAEVELHDTDREIPLEALLRPAEVFAGAYPWCADIVKAAGFRIATIGSNVEKTVGHLVKCAKNAYGKVIGLLKRLGLSDSEVVESLTREGTPGRAAEAVLLAGVSRQSIILDFVEGFGAFLVNGPTQKDVDALTRAFGHLPERYIGSWRTA